MWWWALYWLSGARITTVEYNVLVNWLRPFAAAENETSLIPTKFSQPHESPVKCLCLGLGNRITASPQSNSDNTETCLVNWANQHFHTPNHYQLDSWTCWTLAFTSNCFVPGTGSRNVTPSNVFLGKEQMRAKTENVSWPHGQQRLMSHCCIHTITSCHTNCSQLVFSSCALTL